MPRLFYLFGFFEEFVCIVSFPITINIKNFFLRPQDEETFYEENIEKLGFGFAER